MNSPDTTSKASDSLEPLYHRVVRGSRLSLWGETTARGVLGSSLAFAGALLVGRSILGRDLIDSGSAWIMLGASWLVVGAAAWWHAGEGAMTRREAALWLDLRSDASGRVVTANEITEASAAPWRSDAESRARGVIDVPRARWSRTVLAMALGAAALFATRYVPLRALAGGGQGAITEVLQERLADVMEKLEVLDEEVALEEEERAELEASLERLEEAIQDDPDIEATYEALDRMEEQLAARAEEALADAKAALESLAEQQLDPSRDASGDAAPGAASDVRSEERQAGLQAMEQGLSDMALAELSRLAAGDLSELSKDDLQRLSAALESAMSEPLSALEDAGLLSSARVDSLQNSLKGSPSSFKPAGELRELSDEQLAMLGLCPDCGQEPCDRCASSGEP
ncbi:hypothetical protein Poly30_15070 [Planctomycetes bacterium Poly30]|uniref:Uncharacterized protein n=1 Tax=Saltatorellus ferox TaxID=2528018 RepID=A0A518EPJ4_9BACT|nr:hypothetical protein Poly30_15070 [Planctomycetes bacterium Poly30]